MKKTNNSDRLRLFGQDSTSELNCSALFASARYPTTCESLADS